jgi:hypothetical protein
VSVEIKTSIRVTKTSPFVVQPNITTKLTSPFRGGTSLEIILLLYLFMLLLLLLNLWKVMIGLSRIRMNLLIFHLDVVIIQQAKKGVAQQRKIVKIG